MIVMPMADDEGDENFSYESIVGIRHYVTEDIEGIKGEIKEQIADFIVQEISTDKDVVRTTGGSTRSAADWKPNRGSRNYTRFVLKKFGFDTIQAIEQIARYLGLPSSKFAFAGIKDNQAITAQAVTVEGDYWRELKAAAGYFQSFRIEEVGYSASPLKTGDLWGNNFLIRIRNVDLEPAALESRVGEVVSALEAKGGFLNYFGLQRFGTHRPNSQWIGKGLIMEDYEQAIYELLVPSFPREMPDAIAARKLYDETRDPKQMLDLISDSLFYEKIALAYLVEHPGDFKGAVLALPATIVSLYAYAYQSFLFNEAVSMRIERLGPDLTTPMIGDSVTLLDMRHGQPTRVRYTVDDANQESLAEYIKAGKAAIMAPIMGSRVGVNKGPFFSIYQELFKREGIEKRDFVLEDEDLAFNLRGVFRPIAVYPRNLRVLEIGEDDLNPGKSVVRFVFDLPKGTYATSFLREIMKVDNQYL
jgi:tRNA pseudouridine13 synthase